MATVLAPCFAPIQREYALQLTLHGNYLFVVTYESPRPPPSEATMYAFDLAHIFAADEESIYVEQALCSLSICRVQDLQLISNAALSPPFERAWQGSSDETLVICVCISHRSHLRGPHRNFSVLSVIFDKGISSGCPSLNYDVPFNKVQVLHSRNDMRDVVIRVSKGGTCLLPRTLGLDELEAERFAPPRGRYRETLLQITRTGPPKFFDLLQLNAIYHDLEVSQPFDFAITLDENTNALICVSEPKSSKEHLIDIYDPYWCVRPYLS